MFLDLASLKKVSLPLHTTKISISRFQNGRLIGIVSWSGFNQTSINNTSLFYTTGSKYDLSSIVSCHSDYKNVKITCAWTPNALLVTVFQILLLLFCLSYSFFFSSYINRNCQFNILFTNCHFSPKTQSIPYLLV